MANTVSHPTTVKVTVNEVANYLSLRERRLTLQREADALQRIETAITSKLEAAVLANGAPLRKGKFTLTLVSVSGRPSWKNEFIRVAGEAAADAVVAHLPKITKLTVNGV
jgi:hypothetical protein